MKGSDIVAKVRSYCEENKVDGKPMSIRGFERLCGLGNGTVDGWNTCSPNISTLFRVAAATGIPIGEWLS